MRTKFSLTQLFSRALAAAAATALIVVGVISPISAANAATSVGPSASRILVAPSSTNKLNDVLVSADDIVISGFGANPASDLVRVDVSATGGGTIKQTVTTGLEPVTGGNPVNTTTAYSSLEFTGTVNDANAALAGIQYIAGASFEVASVSVVVSYAGTVGDLYAFNKDNEHFYKFVSTLKTFSEAKAAAAATTFNGMTGYLATSTSESENLFIANRVGGNQAWLGGQHGAAVGGVNQWKWVTGPENGTRFLDQSNASKTAVVNNGIPAYNNWNSGEPNGTTASLDENSLQLISGGTGLWNDLVDGAAQKIGYVIEYGGMGETVTTPSSARTITVDVNYPEVKATSGNCLQNISNTTGVVVLDPRGDGTKCIVKFTSTAATTKWRVPAGVSTMDLLVVGGGGSAGTYGGGGAGEFVEKLSYAVTANDEHTITVGAGGAQSTTSTAGNQGSNSSFATIIAGGGGGGGTLTGPRASVNATSGIGGASSGGSVAGNSDSSGKASVATTDDGDADSYGSAGGAGYRWGPSNTDYAYAAGGGGGAGGVGGNGTLSGTVVVAGNGGAGKVSSVTGDSYSGGGVGGANKASTTAYTGATAGTATHGGGATGAAGTANTGGGGGASGSTGLAGGAGGSGIVALTYGATAAPNVTSHPADLSKIPGQTATFAVTATSSDAGTLTYQWQILTTALTATWSNISAATSASYTTGTLASGDHGNKYRVVVTNTKSGSSATTTSNAATLTISNVAIVDVAWNELNYDYTAGHYVNKVGNGKAVNDKVLFNNVITRDGTCVDSVVTTKTLSNGTIKFYESGTGARGAATNFEVDIDFSQNNGYGEFQYDFYTCGTYGTANEVRVELRNLAITLIDIDYYQWNEATGMDSFTLASNTKIKYGPAGTALATGTTIGTTNGTIPSYPAAVRFQGPSAIDSTIPEDQAIINYGAIQTFNVKMGRSASGSPNYFGVAFKSLTWGSTTPNTQGPTTTYSITYDGNGSTSGTVPTTHTGKVGANFTVAANSGTLVRTGYTFSGWNTAANGSGTTYAVGSSILMPNGGATLYAVWTPAALTLTYNANGGTSAPVAESRNAGSVAALSSSTPSRTGYVFAGWNTAADGSGTNIDDGATYLMPNSNTTLWAKWTAATGTIAYDGNTKTSGTVPGSTTAATGNSTTVSGNTGTLEKTGYTFAGWNTSALGTGTDYAAGASITYPANGQTLTLYAQWTKVIYTLVYNANGGVNPPPSTNQSYQDSVTLAAAGLNPTRTGFTFFRWNTKADGTGTDYAAGAAFTMPAANTTLYAKWTALTYSVTYSGNAPAGQTLTGSQSGSGPHVAAATVTVKDKGTFAVSGYRFVGWNTNADGISGTDYAAAGTFLMPTANVTLYAKWVLSTIKLTYDANGGTNAPPADTHTQGAQINLSTTVPTRNGYTFGGWNTQADGLGTNYASNAPFTIPGSDVVLYAKWTAIKYSLAYDANGGSGAPSTLIDQVIDAVVTLSTTIPNWIGYTFLGWNTLANGGGTDYSPGGSYTIGGNATLYAKWQGNQFTLTYNSNGGTALATSSETRIAGSVANLTSSLPVRSGFTFAGWNTSAAGTGTNYLASASFTMPGANQILYAKWTAITSSVSYDANGGSGAPSGANYNFGDNVTVSPTLPTRSGYTFTGWNTQSGGGGTSYSGSDVFSMPNSSVVLYAQWAAVSYDLNYDANGGAGAPGTSTHAYASTATVSTTLPTRLGYDFLGWNTAQAGNGTARAASTAGTPSTFSMPASNVTLYAQWSLATYTVYYNANGGTANIASQPGRYGTNINISNTVPTRPGYRFVNWNTAPNGSGITYAGGAGFTIPGNNTTMYAQWEAEQYTLTYLANGGDSATVPTVHTGKTVGESFALSATVPTRTGFYFAGWNTEALATGQGYASSANFVMGSRNVILYAQWTETAKQVSYNANGGSGAPNAQQTDGSGNVTISTTVPSRPGYTFQGWFELISGGSALSGTYHPATNIVLYAQWTANTVTVSYNLNGGAGTTPGSTSGTYGTSIQLAGSGAFSKANAVFVSWNTVNDGTGTSYDADEQNFALPSADITLYAIWAGAYVALEYNPAGGTGAPADQFATPGANVNVAPTEPVKTGYDFTSWTDASTGNTYSKNSTLTMPSSNVTLVANWVVKSASTRGNNSTPSTTLTLPMKMNQTVYFKGDRSYLTSATKKLLKALAVKAKKYGYAADITIYGRVKETNDKSYDLKLSKARAANVAAYLKKLGVTGKFKIIAAGISPENKPISRRVDLKLYWPKK